MKLIRLTTLSGLLVAALTALPGQASNIQLGINGDAEVGSNYIDFGNYPYGTNYPLAPGYGDFQVSMVNQNVFPGVVTNEFGQIQSLNEGTGPVTLPGAFMKFDTGGSNLQLWVTNIPPAENGGPFTLFDTSLGAVAAFNVEGYILDANTGNKVDTFTGTFSATFNDETVAYLIANLPVDTPFSATFTATVTPISSIPEPASLLLFGAGLASVGAIMRRKSRKP